MSKYLDIAALERERDFSTKQADILSDITSHLPFLVETPLKITIAIDRFKFVDVDLGIIDAELRAFLVAGMEQYYRRRALLVEKQRNYLCELRGVVPG